METPQMFDLFKRLLRIADEEGIGPPTGKTGNEWTENDFAGLESELARKGGQEFVDYCIEKGDCTIEGETSDKFREILAKYPANSEEEYDLLGVIVRTKLVEAGLLPANDPERYQYKVASWGSTFASHDRAQRESS